MQPIIDIIVKICNDYTDEQIQILKDYVDVEIAQVNFNIGQSFLAGKAYTDQEILTLKIYTDAAILNGANMPTGTIILWYDETGTIPDGWGPCDSGGGRPDYRGRFVKGAGGGNPPGAIGGSEEHSLPFGTGVSTGKTYSQVQESLPPFINAWYIIKL